MKIKAIGCVAAAAVLFFSVPVSAQQADSTPPVPTDMESVNGPLTDVVLEIKSLKADSSLYEIELRNASPVDLFRVIARDYNLNILVEERVSGTITASFRSISLKDALQEIALMSNLVLEQKDKVLVVKPNLITKIFILNHVQAETLINPPAAESDTSQTTQTTSGRGATIYDLLSNNGKVFLGKRPNSIMLIDYPDNVKKVELYLEMSDKGLTSKIFRLKYIKARDIVAPSASLSGNAAASSASAPAAAQTTP
ncbi:MAG: hypothetical protein KJ893_05665 [Candidatus Omnitrophica bacterium]|nr:hypothetical protein [Candidatus Omnitrophota bacterium]MBU4479180.1 hypothetical protein [Candidatus Omnitrophota bacterium]MCG2704083.1 hypothetical protein [Candidatus Omnitrophota bacterium]